MVSWAVGVIVVGSKVMHQPIAFVALAVGLTFVFIIINGICTGISDSNPISSAFVVAVFIMAFAGLKDAGVGLMCASILLIACSVGVDMQQDRSTGWRLGTNRRIQFRYQVIGIVMGACMAVLLAKIFMAAYPVLEVDRFANPNVRGRGAVAVGDDVQVCGGVAGVDEPEAVCDEGAVYRDWPRVCDGGAAQGCEGEPAVSAVCQQSSAGAGDGFCGGCDCAAESLRVVVWGICGTDDERMVCRRRGGEFDLGDDQG